MYVELKTKQAIIDGLSHIDKKDWIKTTDHLINGVVHDKEYRIFLNKKTGEVKVKTNLVVCEIRQGNFRLIEVEQKFNNGKVTHRNIPVTGKIAEGEKPEVGMLREINEEISIDLSFLQAEYKAGNIKFKGKSTSEVSSLMYPGTISSSLKFNYEWEMPLSLYKDHYIEEDGKKVAIFKWVPIPK